MKKILFSILFLFPFLLNAQPVQMPPTGIERGINTFLGALSIKGPIMVPRMDSPKNVVGLYSDFFVGRDSIMKFRNPASGVVSNIVDSVDLKNNLTTNLAMANAHSDSVAAFVSNGFKGSVTPADSPIADGMYTPSVSGLYSKMGGYTVVLDSGYVYINKIGSTYTKTVIPINLSGYAKSNDVVNSQLNYNYTQRPYTQKYNAIQDWDTVITPITNPSTRYSFSYDGNGNVIISTKTSNALNIGLITSNNQLSNRIVIAEVIVDSVDATTGFGISINPSGYNTIDTSNGQTFTWRSNASFAVYKGNATSVAPNITTGSWSAAVPTYVKGDTLAIAMSFSTDGTSASLLLIKNNNVMAQNTFSGIINGYLGTVQRSALSGASFTFKSLNIIGNSSVSALTYFVDSSSASRGDGTVSAPFNSLGYLNLFIALARTSNLNIILRQGTYRGGIIIPPNKFLNVDIKAANGEKVEIWNSKTITSGWTKTGGYTNIYQRATYYNGTLGNASVASGVMDVTRDTTIYTDYGDFKLPYCQQYKRLSPSSSLTSLDTQKYCSFNPGAGIIYTNFNGLDPNTLKLEMSMGDFGITCSNVGGANPFFTKINIEGIVCKYSYGHAFDLKRCYYNVRNCLAMGTTTGVGFAPNDASGTFSYDRSIGCGSDGFNATITTASLLPMKFKTTIEYCDAMFNNVDICDGASNHGGADFYINGCRFWYNGKCGFVPAYGSGIIMNTSCIGNVESGVNSSSAPDSVAQYVQCWNVYCIANALGFQANRLTVGAKTIMELYDCVAQDNTGAGLYVFGSSSTVLPYLFLRSHNTRVSGNALDKKFASGFTNNIIIINSSTLN